MFPGLPLIAAFACTSAAPTSAAESERTFAFAWSESTGRNTAIRLDGDLVYVDLRPSEGASGVLEDLRALDGDVLSECALSLSAKPDDSGCRRDCLFVTGRLVGAVQVDPVENEPYVGLELTGFHVLTPFRTHTWQGHDLNAIWTHGPDRDLTGADFQGRSVDPARYRSPRPDSR